MEADHGGLLEAADRSEACPRCYSMTAGNLRDQLCADQVPLGELRMILTSYFDGAQENGDSILYEKESRPALSVTYTKKGGISSIESRSALSSVDIDEIRQKI